MKESIFFPKGEVKRNIISLTTANLTIGLIEFFFSLYLSRVLGAEGLGILSIVSPVNCLFLSFMTEGLVVTVSKLSAGHKMRGDYAAMAKSIKAATTFSFLWSSFLVIVVIGSSGIIAEHFLGDIGLKEPIMAVCPLMLLMSLSNIVKGHFLGISKIKIPALINIGEKLLRFPIFYWLVRLLLCKNGIHPVTLVYLCYGMGEVFSVVTLAIYYRITLKEQSGEAGIPRNSLFHVKLSLKDFRVILPPVLMAAAPLCLSQCVLEIMNALSSIVVKSRLVSAGFDVNTALALLGKYKGMVFPLMNYPMILVGSIAAISVPRVSNFVLAKKRYACKRLCQRCLSMAVLIGIGTFAVALVFGDEMGMIFYKQYDLGPMIKLVGLFAPVVNCAAISQSLLIACGKEGAAFTNSLLSQLVLLFCLIVFTGIKSINIYGYLISVAIANMLLFLINFRELTENWQKKE